MFGGGGVEQTWLWENSAENGICFGPRNISFIRFIVCLHAQNLKDKPIGGDK